MMELKKQIEQLRAELDESMVKDSYEVYYKKSVELDRLIELYLELE